MSNLYYRIDLKALKRWRCTQMSTSPIYLSLNDLDFFDRLLFVQKIHYK